MVGAGGGASVSLLIGSFCCEGRGCVGEGMAGHWGLCVGRGLAWAASRVPSQGGWARV